MKPIIECEKGSGNVFADLGIANSDEALAKAEIARRINKLIEKRDLDQAETSAILGVDQSRVSALRNGRLALFSLEKLMQFVSRLGNEVEIVIRPSQRSGIKVRAKSTVRRRKTG